MTSRAFNLIFTFTAALTLVGCGQQTFHRTGRNNQKLGTACTDIAMSALVVKVAMPGNPNGTTIKVSRDGVLKGTYLWSSGNAEYQDTSDGTNFTFRDGELVLSGFYEQAGAYSVTVISSTGSSQTKNGIAKGGECHVEGVVLSF